MKLLILSDLHLDCEQDKGKSFVDSLSSEADVVALAGDISAAEHISETLSYFCKKFKHVIFTHGNHEFYSATRNNVISWTFDALSENPNLHWLDNDIVTINGQRFLGTPLWFKHQDNDFLYKHQCNDFIFIPSYEDWALEQSVKSFDFLKNNIEADDIVISHFVPSANSFYGKFKYMTSNRFYLHNCESIIAEKKPKMWVHGHTHQSSNYVLNKTKIICNPKGQDFDEINKNFDSNLIIELMKVENYEHKQKSIKNY